MGEDKYIIIGYTDGCFGLSKYIMGIYDTLEDAKVKQYEICSEGGKENLKVNTNTSIHTVCGYSSKGIFIKTYISLYKNNKILKI